MYTSADVAEENKILSHRQVFLKQDEQQCCHMQATKYRPYWNGLPPRIEPQMLLWFIGNTLGTKPVLIRAVCGNWMCPC